MDKRRKYDWAAIQAYYDRGHTYYDCIREFGFSSAAWQKALARERDYDARSQMVDRTGHSGCEGPDAPQASTTPRRVARAEMLPLRYRHVAGQAALRADRPHQRSSKR
jgi:hypothetical protein